MCLLINRKQGGEVFLQNVHFRSNEAVAAAIPLAHLHQRRADSTLRENRFGFFLVHVLYGLQCLLHNRNQMELVELVITGEIDIQNDRLDDFLPHGQPQTVFIVRNVTVGQLSFDEDLQDWLVSRIRNTSTLRHSLLHASMSQSHASCNNNLVLALRVIYVLWLQDEADQPFTSSYSDGFHVLQGRSDSLILR